MGSGGAVLSVCRVERTRGRDPRDGTSYDGARRAFESRKEELNEQLVWLREHLDARERVTVTYFRPDAKKAGGAYVTVTGAVKKIDEYEKTLWMEDGTVIAIEELSAVEIPGKDRYEEE